MGYIHTEIFSSIKEIELIYLQEYDATVDNTIIKNKPVSEIQVSCVVFFYFCSLCVWVFYLYICALHVCLAPEEASGIP